MDRVGAASRQGHGHGLSSARRAAGPRAVGERAGWLLSAAGRMRGFGQMPGLLPAQEPPVPRRGIWGQRPAAPAAGGLQMGALPRLVVAALVTGMATLPSMHAKGEAALWAAKPVY